MALRAGSRDTPCMDERAIAECFDEEVTCCTPKVLEKRRTQSSAIADAVEDIGIHGLTVLEIGSGLGELLRELVRRGASRAMGIDLSPNSIELARSSTREEGLEGQISFVVANGAEIQLDEHDVVVLDRVICCYPNANELVSHTAAAARRIYAFKLPRYEGPLRLFWRISFGFENAFHALHRRDFRAYLHDVSEIDRWLREMGFRQQHRSSRRAWLTAVYVRG